MTLVPGFKSTIQTAATAGVFALLCGCGGGNDAPPALASVTLTGAFTGTYIGRPVQLTAVVGRLNQVDPYSSWCEFGFSGMTSGAPVEGPELTGTISYAPITPTQPRLEFTTLSIGLQNVSFGASQDPRATIDMANATVVFSGLPVHSPKTQSNMTVTGVIPLPPNRTAGC
jgi:hypothetical protein